MQMTQHHKTRFITWWLVIFYLLALYKYGQGLWLFQCDPFMFTTRFDGVTWVLMQTGLHRWVMGSYGAQVLFDVLFYGFPLLFGLVYVNWQHRAWIWAWPWLVVNWLYVQVYTLYPINSIEAHTAWLLFPFLFATRSLRSFYYMLHGLRYFFLYFFFSAGIWKLVQGGAFEPTQMAGILMDQHREFLVSSPGHWHTRFIYALIEMPLTSFILYWAGIIIELIFVIGFFTRRYDKLLIALFVLFLVFDMLIMRIPYFEVSPFLLLLFFAHYKEPAK